nr:LuxR C-terminal-related transcriptional regulator [Burkholderia vietnamiensis]
MELRDGRLRQATARFRMLVEGGAGAQDYAFASAWFGVLYAFTLFESGDLEQADYLLETFLASSRQVGLPDHMIGSYVMRSRIAYARGDVATALELLCELEHDGLQRELKRVAASASLERARIFTLQGQLPAADHALNRAADLISWERVSILSLPAHETDDLVIGRIRLLIAAGKASEASALIAKESMAAATRYRRLMKLELFSVLAQWAAGHASVACSKLRTLLEACSREGYLRLVVDEGAAVVPVLRRFHADIRSGSKSERNPILQDYVERMLGILGALTSSNVADAQGSETLSQKELSVLTLIADGYSNQAISDELEISDSTVRTHLRNINRKLGAQSRTQAVAVARRRMILM